MTQQEHEWHSHQVYEEHLRTRLHAYCHKVSASGSANSAYDVGNTVDDHLARLGLADGLLVMHHDQQPEEVDACSYDFDFYTEEVTRPVRAPKHYEWSTTLTFADGVLLEHTQGGTHWQWRLRLQRAQRAARLFNSLNFPQLGLQIVQLVSSAQRGRSAFRMEDVHNPANDLLAQLHARGKLTVVSRLYVDGTHITFKGKNVREQELMVCERLQSVLASLGLRFTQQNAEMLEVVAGFLPCKQSVFHRLQRITSQRTQVMSSLDNICHSYLPRVLVQLVGDYLSPTDVVAIVLAEAHSHRGSRNRKNNKHGKRKRKSKQKSQRKS